MNGFKEYWNIHERTDGLNQPHIEVGSSAYRNAWNDIGNSGHNYAAMVGSDLNLLGTSLNQPIVQNIEVQEVLDNIDIHELEESDIANENFENIHDQYEVPLVLECHLTEVEQDEPPDNEDEWQQVLLIDEDVMII